MSVEHGEPFENLRTSFCKARLHRYCHAAISRWRIALHFRIGQSSYSSYLHCMVFAMTHGHEESSENETRDLKRNSASRHTERSWQGWSPEADNATTEHPPFNRGAKNY
jgi:hypothetical protein